ncbi:OmpA family protein [Luteolibacter luteus]|uniref:OmpA family protein n=1 Tax=Luteolibacter luteus TaxID=2728835 RepID=A0A858REL4_9BACT|nr:OmpA family protein [Luteolibacter luteus]QJE95536.1 OmpA family protein [Luteolibacter luteus]
MSELPPDPEKEHLPHETPAETPKSTTTLPTSVLAMGFIAVTLVGVLIASAIRSRPAVPDTKDEKDDPALRDARARIQMLQESVNTERQKLGLSPMYGQTAKSADEVAARITEDAATLVALAKSVPDLIAKKDAEMDKLNQDYTESLKLQGILRDQLAKSEEKLGRALIDGSEASTLRTQLDAANKRVISLGDEVRRLKEGPGELQARLNTVIADRDSLKARLAELESRLSQASLFAGTESQLFKEAVELFRSLRELENKPDSEISAAYSQYGAKMGANVLDRIEFPTGSSDIPPEIHTKIAGFAAEAPDNALLIVIGYASETGNVDSNRTLSSERATAVAKVLDEAKKPGQRVQAAYLGQTDRFGSKFPERNQISEVWQIVPKTNN